MDVKEHPQIWIRATRNIHKHELSIRDIPKYEHRLQGTFLAMDVGYKDYPQIWTLAVRDIPKYGHGL